VLQKPFPSDGLERVSVGNDRRPPCLFLEFTGINALIEYPPRFDLPFPRARPWTIKCLYFQGILRIFGSDWTSLEVFGSGVVVGRGRFRLFLRS
jgi:hypothetical protein